MNIKTIEEIFLNERTCYNFMNRPVEKSTLRKIYDLIKFGPTSMNSSPLRILFIQSSDAKTKIETCVYPTNTTKIKNAPLIAIFAYDNKFYTKLSKLFPINKTVDQYFINNLSLARETAQRNALLQAAYFLVGIRAFGLACCPMSGFDSAKVNDLFFKDTDYEVDFISTIGYRSEEETNSRLPRLEFDEACKII